MALNDKEYKNIFTKRGDTLSSLSQFYFGDTSKVNDILNYKGKDEQFSNSEKIFSLYSDEEKKQYGQANADYLIAGTLLSIPKKDFVNNVGVQNTKTEDILVNTIKSPFWTVDVKNWWQKQKTVLSIGFNKDELLVKRFNRLYAKIYVRSLKKVIDISPFILQGNIQVGKFGGGFSLSLQPVLGKYQNGNYDIDYTTFFGDQFLSKVLISVENIQKVYDNNYFENILNPQDLVVIKIDEPFLENDSIDLNSEDDYDMIALIDKIFPKIQQSNESVSADIEITGRDLSKIFIEDGTYFFPFEFYADPESPNIEEARKKYIVNASDIRDENTLTRIFGKLNEIELSGNRTIKFLLEFILKKLKNITLDLTNNNGVFGDPGIDKDGIWKFIEFDIEENVSKRSLYNSSLTTMSGSIINFLKEILKEPFVEILSETIGNKYRLLVRTPPILKDTLENNLTLEISIKYLISDNTFVSDENIYSWFLMRPEAEFFGDKSLMPILFPAVYLEKYAQIFGSKKYDTSHAYTVYDSVDVDKEEQRIDSRIQSAEDFKFLIEGFSNSLFLKSGTLTFQNIKNLKRGMNIYIPEIDMLYYVEGYSHNLSINERLTTVNVSHGLRKNFIDLFFSIVKVEINKSENKITSAKFNEEVFNKLLSKKYVIAK